MLSESPRHRQRLLLRRYPALIGTVAVVACGAAVTNGAGVSVGARRQVWAFTAPWDARSDASARAHASQLDAIVYGWIQLDSLTGLPFSGFRDTVSRTAPSGMRPMAIVTNAVAGRFHAEAVRRLAADRATLGRAAADIARRAVSGGYRGLVLDLEALGRADLPANRAVVEAIADSARAVGIAPIAVAIPAVDTAGYPASAFVPAADYVLVMLYDQHWTTSPPGPIAAPDWVRRALAMRVAEVGPSRVVAALPLYGYRWPTDRPASGITFDEARRDAAAAGVDLRRDPASQTLHAARQGAWELWVSDAGLLSVLLRDVDALGVRIVALWRLGQEDPAFWSLLEGKSGN